MKQTILIITLFFGGQIFAQNQTKSEQIAKEIQLLELENNKLILNEYIKEQCDTTSYIPIQNFSRKLVIDFQNKNQNLKELKDEFDKTTKAIDAIKYSDSEYRKYRENFVGSIGDERKKQEAIYRNIYSRLYNSNKKFKELNDENKKILAKLNYLTLVQMTADYQQRGEILSTKFIPYTDLYRYREISAVKENQKKIDILNGLYKKILEKEFRLKYNISDSIKTDNTSTDKPIPFD
jgi:hypothetical protein